MLMDVDDSQVETNPEIDYRLLSGAQTTDIRQHNPGEAGGQLRVAG